MYVLYLNICSHFDQAILLICPDLTKISVHVNQKKLGRTPWPGAMPSGPLQPKVRVGWEKLGGAMCVNGTRRRSTKRPDSSYLDHAWEEGCAVFDLPESLKPGPVEARWPHVGRC